MTSHRTISLTLTLLAVLAAGAPSSASANPLLSGYGGPGEGNQAILGSALLGGAGGGTGGGGSSNSSGTSLSGTAGSGTPAGQGNGAFAGVSGRGSGVRGAGRAAGRGSGSRGGSGKASGGAARTYPVSSADSTSQSTPGASETLGVSGDDLGYMLLALGALALTGVLTRRLARTSRPEGL